MNHYTMPIGFIYWIADQPQEYCLLLFILSSQSTIVYESKNGWSIPKPAAPILASLLRSAVKITKTRLFIIWAGYLSIKLLSFC